MSYQDVSGSGDVLLIVPPFAMTNYPSLALHSLQAVGRKLGFEISVLYANMHFASFIGSHYEALCSGGPELPGESTFAAAAWGRDFLKPYSEREKHNYSQVFYPPIEGISAHEMEELSRQAEQWIESFKGLIENWRYPLIGLTSSYEQTNASVAILKALKEHHPKTVSFIGGYNAEGAMAEGLASLDPKSEFIDYIFSGEAEPSFASFLRDWKDGSLPSERIIRGAVPQDLNELPMPNYDEYFEQLEQLLPEEVSKGSSQIAMETSRGCWWGEKSHCLFCGYADDRLKYREKSQQRVLSELNSMEKYPSRYGHMADLIMPKAHFDGVILELARREKDWTLYYEQRAAWDRSQLELLDSAGIRDNQPGIETLSSKLLGFIGKGTNVKNNLTFLREATGVGNRLYWNFVWGFPGEKLQEYRDMTAFIPIISHLIPPIGIFRLALARFSPFMQKPEKWGIEDIFPLPAYGHVFPDYADLDHLAYYFIGEYEAETFKEPSVMEDFVAAVDRWSDAWSAELTKPRLMITRSGAGKLILLDTRDLGSPLYKDIDEATAKLLLQNSKLDESKEQQWALKFNFALAIKGDFVPLATVDNQLRKELIDDREN